MFRFAFRTERRTHQHQQYACYVRGDPKMTTIISQLCTFAVVRKRDVLVCNQKKVCVFVRHVGLLARVPCGDVHPFSDDYE